MARLGGKVITTENAAEFSSAIKGETLEDSIRIESGYGDVIVLRHKEKGAAARAAAVSDVPVINAGDGDGEHPTQALLDLLKKNASHEDPARVIFISSVAASEVFKHVMAYSTSKKGLEHMTPQLALALCDDHILVNSIAPGRFYSEMTRGAWKDPESDSFKQSLQRIPAHRYGGLEDMAGVAVMLCSRAGSYFTGEVLNLDGGHRLRH